MNPQYVARLNAFLNSYADACEARGEIMKALRVRCETIPAFLGMWNGRNP